MGVINSWQRRRRLEKLTAILGAQTFLSIREGGSLDDAMSAFKAQQEALEALLDLLGGDSKLADVHSTHALTRDDLRDLYGKLRVADWEGGVFVPVATLTSPRATEFVAIYRNQIPWERIVILLLEYFERRETGPVPLTLRGPLDPAHPARLSWDLQQEFAQTRDPERPLESLEGVDSEGISDSRRSKESALANRTSRGERASLSGEESTEAWTDNRGGLDPPSNSIVELSASEAVDHQDDLVKKQELKVIKMIRMLIGDGVTDFAQVVTEIQRAYGAEARELDEFIEAAWDLLTNEDRSVTDVLGPALRVDALKVAPDPTRAAFGEEPHE